MAFQRSSTLSSSQIPIVAEISQPPQTRLKICTQYTYVHTIAIWWLSDGVVEYVSKFAKVIDTEHRKIMYSASSSIKCAEYVLSVMNTELQDQNKKLRRPRVTHT